MTDDEAAVRGVNKDFYDALETQDTPRMIGVWLHEDWVQCIHPRSDVLKGWAAVRASWERMFAATEWIRVTPTAVDVYIQGDLALVRCAENITAQQDGEVRVAVALATNAYQRTPDGWRMIHHHASNAPVNVTAPYNGTVQ